MTSPTLTSVFRAVAATTTFVALSLTPTLALGPQVQQIETPDALTTSEAPMPMAVTSPVPATLPDDPGCTPTTSLLRFDGGYEVSMCYRTPEGETGEAKAGLYASAESGLLWFFSRENAEVLVKVLNGCAINGYRWVFVAPVTTLEFDLWVTSPTGARWTHGNTQGVTAATKSDVAAFACADEPDAAADLTAPSSLPTLPALAAGPQLETASDSDTSGSDTPVFVPVTSPSTPSTQTDSCTPTTSLLHFDGGYEVSMCYRTPDGVAGQAKAGLYASAESGLLWFFSRDNAEVLVKVLNGCAINGHRWVFVAPVTTLEFDLWVTSPTGARWTHGNTQGVTAATKSDVAAFACADEPDAAPDLIVSRASVSDATPVVGQTIALRATVRNRGDDAATPTTISYYQSEDSTISASDDVSFGSAAVPALSASATESMTLDFRVPSTPGTLYLGACIKPFSAESRTGNNCSTGVRVVVEDEPEAAPDLIVSRVSVSNATPVAGQTITLRATVRNRGDGPASRTTIRYYRSGDSTITTSDVSFARDAVAALAASAAESLTLDFRVPSTPGTFHLGACIDSVSGETRTDNNCSAGVRVTVEDEPEEPATAPDLIVSGVTVSDATPVAGQNITLRATVRNRGDGPASRTTIRYYRSGDSTISASDRQLGANAVPALAASATESRTLDLLVSAPGTFYFGACIDSVSAESDTGNNCSNGALVTVEEPGPPPPDLIVSSVSVSDDNPDRERNFSLHAAVRNGGDGPASMTTLRYYRSDDSTITTSDVELDSDPVSALAAAAAEARTYYGPAPSTPGMYYLGVCIDSVSAESDTDNNCSDGVPVTVEPKPDLVVSSVQFPDTNPTLGQNVDNKATVLNRGDGSASPTKIGEYRSNDSTITTADQFIQQGSLASLAASTTVSVLFAGAFSSPDSAYFGYCIDSVPGESNTDNNCSDGVLVVAENEPDEDPAAAADLIVSGVSVNHANPVAGQNIAFHATVRNGGGAAALTTLRYYQSDDSTITTSDSLLASDPVTALSVSAAESRTLVHTVSAPGTFYFGACIDPVSAESDTNNNCSDGVLVTVAEPAPAPDLIVSSVSVNDDNARISEISMFTVTVLNRGDGPASSTTMAFFLSDDPTITTSDPFLETVPLVALAASATASTSTEWVVHESVTPGRTYYFGACINTDVGESDTDNNCSAGLPVVVD